MTIYTKVCPLSCSIFFTSYQMVNYIRNSEKYIRRILSRVSLQTAFSNMQRRVLPSFLSPGSGKQNELVVVLYDQQLKIIGGKGIVLEEIPGDEATFLHLVPDALQKIFPDDQNLPLILVLPPAFFQFTPFELPGIEVDKLRQALRLQLPQLLPGSSENEILGHMDFNYKDDHGCALWLKGDFIEKLFNELFKRNIILVKIIPRPVSVIINKPRYCVEDYDEYQSTCVAVEDNKICHWNIIYGKDKKNDTFLEEYNKIKQNIVENNYSCVEVNQSCLGWDSINDKIIYFVPDSYNEFYSKNRKAKIKRGLLLLFFLVIVVVLFPFARLGIQEHNMRKELVRLKEQNSRLIKLSSKISSFVEKWGVITEFPNIDVANLLVRLNNIIPDNSWLVSLSLDNGILEITGYSPDPGNILRIFSEQEIFYDVSYSQVVRSDQDKKKFNYFGIQCKLKNIDIPAYLEKYFRDENEY